MCFLQKLYGISPVLQAVFITMYYIIYIYIMTVSKGGHDYSENQTEYSMLLTTDKEQNKAM